ncbi:MAG: hypothetical protein ACKO8Z_11640 [Prosthecobacter sp.]
MKTVIAFTTVLCLAASLTGCATIFNRNQKNINVTSTPSGLNFEIKDRGGLVVYRGTTPTTVKLSTSYGYFKSQNYTLNATRNGKVVGTRTIDARVTPWYWGNFILGGLLGLVVIDPLTGSMFTLPADAHIGHAAPDSGPLALQRPGKSDEVHVVSLADVPPHLRSKLVRL